MINKIKYNNKFKDATYVQVPLFIIELAAQEKWMRHLAVYTKIKNHVAKNKGGFFKIDSELSVNVDISRSNLYKHIAILIKKGLIEKREFKNDTIYSIVGKKRLTEKYNHKQEHFFTTVIVFDDNSVTQVKHNLYLKLIEQLHQQQAFAISKKKVNSNDYCKPNDLFTHNSKGWLSYDKSDKVMFDDYYIADKLNISQRLANNMRHYYIKRGLISIDKVYKEVLSDVSDKETHFKDNMKHLKREISHITYFSNKIIYLIGSSYYIYSYFNNSIILV